MPTQLPSRCTDRRRNHRQVEWNSSPASSHEPPGPGPMARRPTAFDSQTGIYPIRGPDRRGRTAFGLKADLRSTSASCQKLPLCTLPRTGGAMLNGCSSSPRLLQRVRMSGSDQSLSGQLGEFPSLHFSAGLRGRIEHLCCLAQASGPRTAAGSAEKIL